MQFRYKLYGRRGAAVCVHVHAHVCRYACVFVSVCV